MDVQTEELKQDLDNSENIVAVTGAGISVASGGMTFDHSHPGDMQDLMVLGSEEVLVNDPDRYYRALDQAFLHSMFAVGPSLAHRALARMEEMGKLTGIITTNVDCLHTIAGSENVAEIQGSLQVNRCVNCGCHYDDYEIWDHGQVPVCSKCGGKIWPFPFYSHVGLYREAVSKARKMIRHADLILIIGASGNYEDAYWPFRNRKAKIIQINPGRTWFDEQAVLNIRQDADSVFRMLKEADDQA